MKKLFLFCVMTILMSSLTVHAQEFGLGIIGGVSSNTFDMEGLSYKSVSSSVWGGIFSYSKSRYVLTVQPQFVERGANVFGVNIPSVTTGGDSAFIGPIDIKYKLTYFDFPVLIRLNLSENKSTPFIITGVTLAFLSKDKRDVDLSQLNDEDRETIEMNEDILEDSFKSMDFMYSLGAGLNINIQKRINIFIEGRLNVTLSSATDVRSIYLPNNVRNTSYQFLSGITYSFSKKSD